MVANGMVSGLIYRAENIYQLMPENICRPETHRKTLIHSYVKFALLRRLQRNVLIN